jgi:polar amino acid transport system substrate-binding protein
MQIGQMALVRKAEITELGSEQSLYFTSGRVGFVRGTTGETFVRGSLRLARLVPVDSPEQGVEWLSAGKIDVFVHDAPTIWRISSSGRYPGLAGLYWPLTQEDLAWAVKRGNQDLAQEVGAVLTLWKQTGRLQLVLNRWMKTRMEYAPGG